VILRAGVLIIAAMFAGTAIHAQGPVAEPELYRSEDYRAPTPPTLRGARVVTTTDAEMIWREKRAAFIDVMPRPPKPANLPPETVWRDKPRHNIPGSLWLVDTGYGKLAAATDSYFRDGLARASQGDRNALLVFYCQADCWMSWNAARRAVSYGYRNVAWFPAGTDGWEQAHLPLVEAQPVPRPQ
jgi:PQQ-dependent catabolism-associated CXXCW motif protein